MNIRFSLLPVLFFVFSSSAFCQTQKDTIFAPKSIVPVVIDGNDNDAVWSKTDWKPIDQVWIPYAAKMAPGDFEGKYKVAWDSLYLYVLVRVVDDVLSDDHVNPLQNWWDDDCVEIFLDENRSKGNHERNNNAFAYHVSTKYDAVDLDANGNGINYKNNLKVVMDTIGTNTYLWEFAIKNYNATFNISNPEASRVKLTAKKLMGFTIAYCDNDLTTSRENFIGSMYMTAATANNNYITADYFGSLLLVNQLKTAVLGIRNNDQNKLFSVYPNPARNQLKLERNIDSPEKMSVELRSITGALVKSLSLEGRNQLIKTDGLIPGIYLLTIKSGQNIQTERISIQ